MPWHVTLPILSSLERKDMVAAVIFTVQHEGQRAGGSKLDGFLVETISMIGNGFSESCPVGAWMRYQFQLLFQ
ncbi:hypothetical protein SDJN03_00992, partial [Cucurbita argyrosperma subsp. sororia]